MSLWLVLAAVLVPLVLVAVVLLLISRPRKVAPDVVPPLAPSSAFLAPAPVTEAAVLAEAGPVPASRPAPVAPPPAAPAPPMTVVLDTGRALPLTGPIVIGRDPLAPPSHPGAAPVTLPDLAHSISKTHLLVAPAHSGVLVMDLHSVNGVAVTLPNGNEATLTAGSPMVVPPASTVTFGERSLEVR